MNRDSTPPSRAALAAQVTIATPLGALLAAATDQGLAGLWFEGQAHHPGVLDAPQLPDHRWLAEARTQIDAYFAGRRLHFDLPLDPWHGTPFQRSVWQVLQGIPAGRTLAYRQVAAACQRPAAVRAVGAAIGRNPLSIIVPCHRVVGANGALTGYAGGLDRKRALLALEAIAA